MLNEGIVVNTTDALMKTEMLKQIRRLGGADTKTWSDEVFRAVTGQPIGEVDWEFEDNQAGYYTYVRSFDRMVQELVEDGYVKVDERNGEKRLVPLEVDPSMDVSHAVYPSS